MSKKYAHPAVPSKFWRKVKVEASKRDMRYSEYLEGLTDEEWPNVSKRKKKGMFDIL